MSLTYKNINVPSRFAYCITLQNMSDLLMELAHHFPTNNQRILNKVIYENPSTGIVRYDDVDVFIYNQSKQGIIVLFFENCDEYKKLCKKCDALNKLKLQEIKHHLYRYNSMSGWVCESTYEPSCKIV